MSEEQKTVEGEKPVRPPDEDETRRMDPPNQPDNSASNKDVGDNQVIPPANDPEHTVAS